MKQRNVIDFYKYWKNDAIIADLDTKRHNFSVLCSNLYNDFNISTVIRSANAFLAKEVIIYGSRRWDRRGAVGTQNYTNFKYVKSIEEDEKELNKVLSQFDFIVGIDNIECAKPIESFKWECSKNILICFGQEQYGLPKEIIKKCNEILYIRQYGSVRSLNVGVASGIVMFDYCSKINK